MRQSADRRRCVVDVLQKEEGRSEGGRGGGELKVPSSYKLYFCIFIKVQILVVQTQTGTPRFIS
jgi:hypothetical protein